MASGGSSEGKQLSPIEVCTACDTGDHAEHYCSECQEYLCAECTKSHRRQRKTKEHTLTGLQYTDSVKAKNYNLCPEHEGSFINKFCVPCFKIGCEACMTQNHYTHKFVAISNYSEAIYNLCLDKTKELQGPFNKLSNAKKNIEQNRQLFYDSCNTTKQEIEKRKEKVIKMAAERAEKAQEEIENAKQQMMSTHAIASEKLDEVLFRCKSIATPLGLGTDVNAVVKRMLLIETEITEANDVLASVDQLESKSNVKLSEEDVFRKIDECSESYFQIKTGDKLSSCIPIVTPRKTVAPSPVVPTKRLANSAAMSKKDPLPSNTLESAGSAVLPTELHLVNKTETKNFYHISKYVVNESFVAQEFDNGPVKRMSYINDAKELPIPRLFNPKPSVDFARGILTLSIHNHVIISKEAINLCDNSKVILSQPHTQDEYFPNVVGHVDKHKFITVCTNQKKLRYHDTGTLKVLNTYSLNRPPSPNFILCTNDGRVLLQTSYKELTQFSAEGQWMGVVPIQSDFFSCHTDSVCIDRDNNIFGVKEKDHTILVFDLKGEHQILGQVDYKLFWNAGIDHKRQYYLSYNANPNKEGGFMKSLIVKYKY